MTLRFSPEQPKDLLITVTSTGDTITVRNFLRDDAGADFIEQIQFANGTTWTHTDILNQFSRLLGTENPDNLAAIATGSLIYGRDDDDTLTGGAGQRRARRRSWRRCDDRRRGQRRLRRRQRVGRSHRSAGGGIDTVFASVDWELGANFENLTLEGGVANYATGNALDNIIHGNWLGDHIDGGSRQRHDVRPLGLRHVLRGLGRRRRDRRLATRATTTSNRPCRSRSGRMWSALTLLGTANLNGTGNDLVNHLWGNSGNNILDGGADWDYLEGGAGDDTYIVDSTYENLTEGSNKGNDTVKSYVTWTLANNFENLELLGTDDTDAIGNGVANVLRGNSGSNLLDGKGGADTMYGGGGDDFYVANLAGDTANELAGEGHDSVTSSVSFTLSANVEDLTLSGSGAIDGYGNSSDNVITGNGGINHLEGGAGNDTLNGGGAADTMIGGTGDDIYFQNVAGDVVTELAGEGFDILNSAVGGALAANVEVLFQRVRRASTRRTMGSTTCSGATRLAISSRAVRASTSSKVARAMTRWWIRQATPC